MSQQNATTTKTQKVMHVGVIIPAAGKHGGSQDQINQALPDLIKRLDAAAIEKGEQIVIHYLTGKKATYAQKDGEPPNPLETAAELSPNITTKPYTPNAKYFNQSPKGSNGREPFITASNLARNVDAIAHIHGLHDDVTNKAEQTIISQAEKKQKPIVPIKIQPVTNEHAKEKAQAKPTPNRVNVRNYATWQDLLADPNIRITENHSAPIYCGGAYPKKNLAASPLENKHRNKQNWQDLYRKDLFDAIQAGNKAVIAELEKIDRETVLACWCEPSKPCHTDIIRNAAIWYRKQSKRETAKTIVTKASSQLTSIDLAAKIALLKSDERSQRARLHEQAKQLSETLIAVNTTINTSEEAYQTAVNLNAKHRISQKNIVDAQAEYATTLVQLAELMDAYTKAKAEEEKNARRIEREIAEAKQKKAEAEQKATATTPAQDEEISLINMAIDQQQTAQANGSIKTRCKAIARTTGNQCKRYASPGSDHCTSHGG